MKKTHYDKGYSLTPCHRRVRHDNIVISNQLADVTCKDCLKRIVDEGEIAKINALIASIFADQAQAILDAM